MILEQAIYFYVSYFFVKHLTKIILGNVKLVQIYNTFDSY